MYGKLEVGQPAMIINTRLPELSWLIGSVVMVEACMKAGENASRFYVLPHNVALADSPTDSVYVSGCKITGATKNKKYPMHKGFACFDPKNLMPLPPLEEKQLAKNKELELA